MRDLLGLAAHSLEDAHEPVRLVHDTTRYGDVHVYDPDPDAGDAWLVASDAVDLAAFQ